MNEPSDEELMASLTRGDEAALAMLYDRYSDVLFRSAMLRVADRQLAEEILQDTYLALWNRAELYDAREGSLIGWLSAICRNRSIDRLRALGRRPPPLPLGWLADDAETDQRPAEEQAALAQPVAMGPPATDPESAVEIGWLRAEVGRALDGMPEDERQVIALAYYDELSQSEIAERLAWPLGTVKTRTRRALGRLRQSLAVVIEEADGTR